MKLTGQGSIWFDGRLVPWSEAKVHVGTHALHYGSSVFEGIRAYPTSRGPAIFQLDAHVRRMADSCRIVSIPLPLSEAKLTEAIVETVRANDFSSSYIRPMAFRGYGALGVDPRHSPVTVAVIVIEHGPHFSPEKIEKGLELGVSSHRRPAPDTLPTLAKTAANYLNSQLIFLEAKANGFDDGIALDVDGFVSECSGSNVFLVSNGKLTTPSLDCSVLEGITRRSVLTLAADLGIEAVERRVPREMLYMADEVFVCGTAAEVTPVRAIDRIQVGGGKHGPVTERLQREYARVVRGEREDRHEWLTFVR
jgi:branched-chain amino acid aminotransferase